MDMRHQRFIPTLVAATIGAILCIVYMRAFGLSADLGHSVTALASTAAVMAGPGVGAVAYRAWRGDPGPRSSHQPAQIAPIVAHGDGEAALAESERARPAHGERRLRDRRVAARIAQTLPIAWS